MAKNKKNKQMNVPTVDDVDVIKALLCSIKVL